MSPNRQKKKQRSDQYLFSGQIQLNRAKVSETTILAATFDISSLSSWKFSKEEKAYILELPIQVEPSIKNMLETARNRYFKISFYSQIYLSKSSFLTDLLLLSQNLIFMKVSKARYNEDLRQGKLKPVMPDFQNYVEENINRFRKKLEP